jgi:putative membrane protein
MAGTTTTTTTTTAATTSNVGDTFGVLRAIHLAEIEHGTLAQAKSTNSDVKDYAEKVVKDHRTRMMKDDKMMTGLGVAPRDSALSARIRAASDQQTTRLNSLSGAAFDRAYIDEQINYYRTVLDTFDRDLLPNIKDPDLKSQVSEARERANDNLKEAQDLRLSLVNP